MIDAAQGALFCACAEAMFIDGVLAPQLDARLAADWTLIEHITAVNQWSELQPVYFGFLAQSKTDAQQFIAVIRGTEQFSEWLEDAECALIGHVEAGFAAIYRTMECGLPALPAHRGLSARVPLGARVDVFGHSLGAPLACYLTADLVRMDIDAHGMFFAMPRPGDELFAHAYDVTVTPARYKVYNYIRDLVPRLPVWLPLLPFDDLSNIQWIRASARIANNPVSNHQALSYAALLGVTA